VVEQGTHKPLVAGSIPAVATILFVCLLQTSKGWKMGKRVEAEKNNIKANIPVILLEEEGKYIAYSPAIDLSSCGDTEEQARKRFIEAASIFFDEIINMGTVNDVLTECGWHKTPHQNTWLPPKYKSCTEELVPIS
jgi:hypothetical protein